MNIKKYMEVTISNHKNNILEESNIP